MGKCREGLDGGVDGGGYGFIGVNVDVVQIDNIHAQGPLLLTQTEGPCEFETEVFWWNWPKAEEHSQGQQARFSN